MKKTKGLLLLAAMLVSSVSFAQNWWKGAIRGEGEITSRNLNLDQFESITLAFSGDVFIEQGQNLSVRVEAQQNIIDNIATVVEGRHWKIKYDQPVSSSKGVKVYITMPTLREAYVSGSGNIASRGAFEGLEEVKVGVSGSGDIDLELEAKGAVYSKISGSGNVKLAGRSAFLEVGISGSGDVEAYSLEVEKGQVQISGSGDAEVNVKGDLDVRISGSGDVSYKGRPRLHSRVSGSGDVNGI